MNLNSLFYLLLLYRRPRDRPEGSFGVQTSLFRLRPLCISKDIDIPTAKMPHESVCYVGYCQNKRLTP